MSAAEEKANAPDFYRLPDGMTWEMVATQRAKYDHNPRFFPLAIAGGACAWGVPHPKD